MGCGLVVWIWKTINCICHFFSLVFNMYFLLSACLLLEKNGSTSSRKHKLSKRGREDTGTMEKSELFPGMPKAVKE